jgi:hypothetical protein
MAVSTIDPNGLNVGQFGNRNLIINGSMQVAQRGASQSTLGYGSVDRFLFTLSGGTGTMSQEELALGQTDIPSQFRNFLRVNATAGNNNMGFLHRIEDVAVVEGLVTISFYAKGSNPASGSFSLSLYQEFGSGGSTGVLRSVDTFVTTSSWQRFEFTATVPSISGKTVGAGSNLEIFISQADADTGTSAWTLDITGVQLEVGDTATPFEHRSYSDQLQSCKRYYYCFEKADSGEHNGFLAVSYGANSAYFPVQFPVEMRAIPTVRMGGLWATRLGNNNQFTASSGAQNNSNVGGVYYTPVSSVPATTAFWVEPSTGDSSNTAYLNFDAEL